MFRQRPDATYVADVPAMRRVMPYLMPTRTEAAVYFQQEIEIDHLLVWLDAVNVERPPPDRLTLFDVLLTAVARTVFLRPEVNRFVAGARLYQHDTITVAFTVKTALTDEASESQARVSFTGRESVDDVHAMVATAVLRERAGVRDGDDKLIDFFAAWPRPVLRGITRFARVLDDHNALPARVLDVVPLYTSIYLVNTGSLGIEAPFHHLYELGTASAFIAIGRATKKPVVDGDGRVVVATRLHVVFTLDERATDGYYFAKTAEVFRRLVSEPRLLGNASLTVDEIVPSWPPHR